MAQACGICGGGTSIINRRKLANEGVVCELCFREALLTPKQVLSIKKLTVDDVLKAMTGSGGSGEVSGFNATKKIGVAVYFDDEKKQILIPTSDQSHIFNYSDIVGFELMEDGEVLVEGGVGRAIIGGALFGGAGAVVGAVTGRENKKYCDSLKVKLTVNDMSQPAVYITFLNKRTKTKTKSKAYNVAYEHAQECLSTLQLICDRQQNTEKTTQISETDKILEYKKLLDQGIITEEEFTIKKKELLGL